MFQIHLLLIRLSIHWMTRNIHQHIMYKCLMIDNFNILQYHMDCKNHRNNCSISQMSLILREYNPNLRNIQIYIKYIHIEYYYTLSRLNSQYILQQSNWNLSHIYHTHRHLLLCLMSNSNIHLAYSHIFHLAMSILDYKLKTQLSNNLYTDKNLPLLVDMVSMIVQPNSNHSCISMLDEWINQLS